MSIPLVRGETIDSYLARLANANYVPLREMRGCLGLPPTHNGRVDLRRLSIMTGHPPDRLSNLIVGAGPRPGRARMSPLPASRPACRRCAAARGIHDEVHQVDADRRVCRLHRRWLGALGDPRGEQHDCTPIPEVVQAQRRHARLLRRRGPEPGRTAMFWANWIVADWTKRELWGEHRRRRQDRYLSAIPKCADTAAALAPMFNYPETVTLAALLASGHWTDLAGSHRRSDRRPFEQEVARRLDLAWGGFALDDPLVSWEASHAHVLRMGLRQQLDERSPPGSASPAVAMSDRVHVSDVSHRCGRGGFVDDLGTSVVSITEIP